jgi:RNA polymerase sigma-70 factor (ECF subfamily)
MTGASVSEVEACIPALRRYAWALLRHREDADDLVHDCLVRAFDKLHTKREDTDTRAWMFAILHNLFVSQHRRRKVRAQEPLTEAHENAQGVPAAQADKLMWRDMLRALERLPAEQRDVVLMVSVEDLSYAEAATVLGVPIGTVMSRLARGREKLRECTDAGPRPALRRVK